MSLIRIITPLLCGAFLLGSNFANAAMPCCMQMNQPAKQMQMHSEKMEMPCHDMAVKHDKESAKHSGCDCQHCIKMSALPQPVMPFHLDIVEAESIAYSGIQADQPVDIFQPPKRFS